MILVEVAVNLLTRTWFLIRSCTSARQVCRKSPYYRSFDRSANWRVKDAITHNPVVSYPDIESTSLDSVTSSLSCSQVSVPDESDDVESSLRFDLDAAVVTDDRHGTASVYVNGLAVVSKVGKHGCQTYSCTKR